MAKKDGGPAFPYETSGGNWPDMRPQVFSGLSLRDYFAAQAMPELLAILARDKQGDTEAQKVMAETAYELADAMLAARDRENARKN